MQDLLYVLDPDDPRAPSQAVWDAMTETARRHVLADLPSEIPRKFVPEGDPHSTPKRRAREALGAWFRRQGRSVYLGSELAVYYPDERMFAPDLIAVLDVGTHPRESWVVSHEAKGLDFVLEILVSGKRKKDLEDNVERLARLSVPEYFVYEPRRRRISGYRLSANEPGAYTPIVPQGGHWASRVLGLDLALDADGLRFFAGYAALPDADELAEQLSGMVDSAVERAEEEGRRAQEEARRAQEEAKRAQEEARRAQDEAKRAQDEGRRAQDEAKRAQEETRRAERYAAKLRELGIDPDTLE